MPLKEGRPRTAATTAETQPESLAERKKKLFDEIVKQAVHLDSTMREAILVRVFCYSVEDGMELADRLALSPKELRKVLGEPTFVKLHRDFVETGGGAVMRLFSEKRQYQVVFTFMNDDDWRESTVEQLGIGFRESGIEETKPLEEAIDKYYEPFIATKKLKAQEEEKSDRSPGERLFAEQLYAAYLSRVPHYYPARIRDMLWKIFQEEEKDRMGVAPKEFDPEKLENYVVKRLKSMNYEADFAKEAARELTSGDLLDENKMQMLATIAIAKGRLTPDAELKTFTIANGSLTPDAELKAFARDRFRPLDVTTKLRQELAKKKIIEELKALLAKRGYDPDDVVVEWDEKEHEHVVRLKENEAPKEQRPETGFPKWDSFEKKELPKGAHAFTLVDGKLMYATGETFNLGEMYVQEGIPSAIQEKGLRIDSIVDLDGWPAFLLKDSPNGNPRWISYRGKKYGDGIEGNFAFVYDPILMHGKLVFVEKESDSQSYHLIADKRKFGGSNQPIGIVSLDKGLGVEDASDDPTNVGGKLAKKEEFVGKGFYILHDTRDKELIGPFKETGKIYDIGGKPAFAAKKMDGSVVVFHDGKEYKMGSSTEMGQFRKIVEVNGIMFAQAHDDEIGDIIVRLSDEGVVFIGPVYDKILHFEVKDGTILVVTREAGEVVAYTHKLEEMKKGPKPQQEIDLDAEEGRKVFLLDELEGIWGGPEGMDEKELEELLADWTPSKGDMDKASVRASVERLNRAIAEEPAAFHGMFPAKRDPTRKADIEKIVYCLFPELRETEEEKAQGFWEKTKFWKWFGNRGKTSPLENPPASAYVTPKLETAMSGGDPAEKKSETVLEMREPLEHGMISTGIYGAYDKTTNQWRKVLFPVAPEVGAVDERTFTIADVRGLSAVRLPTVLGAKILEDRVRGVDKKKKETPLEVRIDPLGEAIVELPEGHDFTTLIYSLEVPRIPPAPSSTTPRAYANMRNRFETNHVKEMTEPFMPLPEECDVFLASIKQKPPEEQVARIEQYIRDQSYYDFDHGDVAAKYNSANPEERLSLMRERMEEIKEQKPELAGRLEGIMFAGVCADFAILTTALLRRAGFVSGMIMGFRPSGTKVTTADAHATSFVVWPGETSGGYRVISVDGTPSGLTPEEKKKIAEIQMPPLEERAEAKETEMQELAEQARQEFEKIQAILEENDPEEIKKLTNGEIENKTNKLLEYNVRHAHVGLLMRVFNAARYAPRPDLKDPFASKEFEEFIETELINQRKEMEKSESVSLKPPGRQLMEGILEFVKRFSKDKDIGGRPQAFALLQQIIKASIPALKKDKDDELNELMVATAATAVITYLTSKKMGH